MVHQRKKTNPWPASIFSLECAIRRHPPAEEYATTMVELTQTLIESLCEDPSSSRERLLHVGGILFSDSGLDAVSTRELSKVAGANLSAIGYYFGGKEGLYRAAVEHTVSSIQTLFSSADARLQNNLAKANDDRTALAQATAAYVRALLGGLLGLGPQNWTWCLIMREIDHPTAAFEALYQGIFKPLNQSFGSLVVATSGRSPGDAETVILANALIGECLIFHRNRPVILRNFNWDEYTPERIAQVADVVVDGILDALDLPHVVTTAS